MHSCIEGDRLRAHLPPDPRLQPATRRLLDGWLLLALAAFAVGAAPALQISSAYTPALERMPAWALRLSFIVQGLQALAIFLPSLLAALCLHTSAWVAKGRVYSPRAGYFGLGLSAISGGALLIRLLVVGWCVVCFAKAPAAGSVTFFRPEHVLFGLGVLMTILNLLLSVLHRAERAAALVGVDQLEA